MDESNEKILNISKVYNEEFLGYKIITNKQEITVLLSSEQLCCEIIDAKLYEYEQIGHDEFCKEEYTYSSRVQEKKYRCIHCEDIDSFNDKYKNAILYNISYNSLQHCNYYNELDLNTIGVEFCTNLGNFTVRLENRHNGYYQHTVNINSNQFSDISTL